MIKVSHEATFADAQAVFFAIDRDFHLYGWLLCIYGSVLGGKGRDVDLIAVPWRPMADVEVAKRSLVDRLQAEQFGGKYRGCMGTRSFLFMLKDDVAIDLQFRIQSE